MSSVRSVFSICAQNFRKWATDYRMWTVAAILIVMTFLYADDVRKNAAVMGSDVSLWIFPFLYTQSFMVLIFTMPVVLMFCNAPFFDKNQTFVMMRTSRTKWLCGQLLYIILASAAYYLFVFLISILSTFFIAEPSLDWGGTFYSLAYGKLQWEGVPYVGIPKLIVEYFTPIQACWFTFLLSWIGGVFLGMIVFFFNLVTQTRSIGTVVATGFVVWGCWVRYSDGIQRYRKFSPISWITVDYIDVGGMTLYPTLSYCLTVFSVSILIMIIGVFIFGRKKNLDFKE